MAPMTDAATEVLLTSPEVGALIGKSGRTVSRMAADGALPFAQKIPGPNGAYLFRRSDVNAYLSTPTESGGEA